jgi:FMN phosphatase YigB (HAD superfamily)
MSRPLIISDCDEVLLHMIVPFRDWLGEQHGIAFELGGRDFARSMTRAGTGDLVEPADVWRYLNLFFDGEMHRQSPIAGAVAALKTLSEHADVVVLTNLLDHRQDTRTRQLAEHGLDLRVFTNQGPKGPALRAILDEYQPSRAVFIDDLAQHHGSVADLAPDVHRLHLCGEPLIAPHIDCAHRAGHAHARIDDWASALPWLLDRLTQEETA